MKLILCFLLLFLSCTKKYTGDEIYGIWKGKYFNKDITFIFNNDSSFEISIRDSITDIVEKLNGIYEINFQKKPITLSLKKISQLNHPLHTIIEFGSQNSFKISQFAPAWKLRNLAFHTYDSFIFRRINN